MSAADGPPGRRRSAPARRARTGGRSRPRRWSPATRRRPPKGSRAAPAPKLTVPKAAWADGDAARGRGRRCRPANAARSGEATSERGGGAAGARQGRIAGARPRRQTAIEAVPAPRCPRPGGRGTGTGARRRVVAARLIERRAEVVADEARPASWVSRLRRDRRLGEGRDGAGGERCGQADVDLDAHEIRSRGGERGLDALGRGTRPAGRRCPAAPGAGLQTALRRAGRASRLRQVDHPVDAHARGSPGRPIVTGRRAWRAGWPRSAGPGARPSSPRRGCAARRERWRRSPVGSRGPAGAGALPRAAGPGGEPVVAAKPTVSALVTVGNAATWRRRSAGSAPGGASTCQSTATRAAARGRSSSRSSPRGRHRSTRCSATPTATPGRGREPARGGVPTRPRARVTADHAGCPRAEATVGHGPALGQAVGDRRVVGRDDERRVRCSAGGRAARR